MIYNIKHLNNKILFNLIPKYRCKSQTKRPIICLGMLRYVKKIGIISYFLTVE